MKNKMTLLLAVLLAFSLAGCKDSTHNTEETKKPSDWRNSIEYEGNFYVDSETKLLYALDKGTITLWDNSGNGDVLQVLDYNTAESDAIERLDIKDVNGDGSNDISTIFSENEDGRKYNLWLWNKAEGKYKEINAYRNINNPVVSEDYTTVTGTLDRGIFGVITSVYNFTEQLTVEESSVTIANAEAIAQNISNVLSGGAVVSLGEGVATIQSIPCSVYVAEKGEALSAYIAFSSDGTWYIDNGCVGAYRAINDKDGAFEAGVYVDLAGELTDICAQLYGCDVSELTITASNIGTLVALSYDPEGNVIAPDAPQGEETPDGSEAKGFAVSRNWQHLCNILKAGNSSYFCLDPNLSGDNYYHMVSASGETKLVDFTANEYYIQ